MAVIEGQIETLKKLKDVLYQSGITRFGSIAQINDFVRNYEAERSGVFEVVKNELDSEKNQLQIDLANHQKKFESLKDSVANETNIEIKELDDKLKLTREKSKKFFIQKIFCCLKTKTLMRRKLNLQSNFENKVRQKTRLAENEVCRLVTKLNDYTVNRDKIISERCLQSLQELDSTKKVVDGLYNLIAGAIGENSVIKEVQKLSDDFHLFNDFSVKFDPPIYNRKEDDRVYSVQIDHLLVCKAGVFILETKNWSKLSVESIDLRSPVKQILRTSHALFVLLNSSSECDDIDLERHHWGSKQIPVRNVIIMVKIKPKEEFKHVKVLSLKELNGYVTYFDSIFSNAEVENICNYLRVRMS